MSLVQIWANLVIWSPSGPNPGHHLVQILGHHLVQILVHRLVQIWATVWSKSWSPSGPNPSNGSPSGPKNGPSGPPSGQIWVSRSGPPGPGSPGVVHLVLGLRVVHLVWVSRGDFTTWSSSGPPPILLGSSGSPLQVSWSWSKVSWWWSKVSLVVVVQNPLAWSKSIGPGPKSIGLVKVSCGGLKCWVTKWS